MRYDAHMQPDPQAWLELDESECIDLGIDDRFAHERRLNGLHSSSACPPIATVMADVVALTLCAKKRLMHCSKMQHYSITSSA